MKLTVLAALAIMLRPDGAAGQHVSIADTGVEPQSVLSAPIDHRLLVSEVQERATLAGAHQRVDLRADGWNLYGATEYMMWGMLAGGVVGLVVGGVTAPDDLTGPVGIIMGGIMGIGVGGGAGVALYTVRTL